MTKSFRVSAVGAALIALAMIAAGCTAGEEDSAPTSGQAEETTTSQATTTTITDTTTEPPTPETSEETSPEESSMPTGIPCPDGERSTAYVTGVFESVNLRDRPSVSGEVMTKLAVDSALTSILDTETWGDDRQWIAVVQADDVCGWVATSYIKDDAGRLIGFVGADEYVRRALFDLDAATAHGTYTKDGAEAPETPLDDSALTATIAELRKIGQDNPKATVRPDASVEVDEGAPDGVGCVFGDGLICQVEVVSEGNEVVAVVSVAWYGDGVTDAKIVSPT